MPLISKKEVIRHHLRIAIREVLAERDQFDAFFHIGCAREMLYERTRRTGIRIDQEWEDVFASNGWGDVFRKSNTLYNWMKHDRLPNEDHHDLDFNLKNSNELLIYPCLLRFESLFEEKDDIWFDYMRMVYLRHPDVGIDVAKLRAYFEENGKLLDEALPSP